MYTHTHTEREREREREREETMHLVVNQTVVSQEKVSVAVGQTYDIGCVLISFITRLSLII